MSDEAILGEVARCGKPPCAMGGVASEVTAEHAAKETRFIALLYLNRACSPHQPLELGESIGARFVISDDRLELARCVHQVHAGGVVNGVVAALGGHLLVKLVGTFW